MELFNYEVSNKILVAVAIAVLLVSVNISVTALPLSTQNISGSGFVYTVGLGVYANSACTVNATTVDWGQLTPGSLVSKTAYIKNNGSANMTLAMAANSWNPTTMQQYITIFWNATNYVLAPNQVVAANFTLAVSSNAQGGTFTNNISISGQGV